MKLSAPRKGAGRILAAGIASLILGLVGSPAWAQNNASSVSAGASSVPPVQAASLQNGTDRGNGPSSRVTLSSSPGSIGAVSGHSAVSSPPPSTGTAASSYGQGGMGYGVNGGGELGYVEVTIPHGGVHGEAGWAGPVMPDERDRGPRRLSTEERLRLRSDIRDASRNMYEHPRAR